MKKFSVCVLTACLLLTGCGDEETPEETAIQAEENSSAEKTSTVENPKRDKKKLDEQTKFYADRAKDNYDKKNYREAVNDATEAIRLDPANVNAYTCRGYAYSELGNYRDAVADLNKVIELDPNNAKAYGVRGVALANTGDNKKAVADFDKAISLKPNDVANYENRGLVYGNMGDFKSALADFDKVISLKPTAEAYQRRAQCYEALGDNEKAQADLAKANELTK